MNNNSYSPQIGDRVEHSYIRGNTLCVNELVWGKSNSMLDGHHFKLIEKAPVPAPKITLQDTGWRFNGQDGHEVDVMVDGKKLGLLLMIRKDGTCNVQLDTSKVQDFRNVGFSQLAELKFKVAR